MMRYILFFVIPFFLYASSSFITPTEYAAQLYKNPRGIGCQLCHGNRGEGKLIANYVHKKKKKSFSAPAINTISFREFHNALSERKRGMPRYFLTDNEIEALYLHLHKNDKVDKKDVK
jgi:mono/diheme cytochrome c family protein